MSDVEEYVTRPTRQASWTLVRDAAPAAHAHALCQPDGHWHVSIDAWDETAYEPLAAAIGADLRQDLYTIVDEADPQELLRWRRLGFAVNRREVLLEVPVDPAETGLGDPVLPGGMAFVSADAVDEIQLRELDDTLRAQLPGATVWRNDPVEFHEYTFDGAHFDPATYLVAVDDIRQAFAGLVRVWVSPGHSRLGLIAVVRGYRRRGLARALLAAAFAPLHERGIRSVMAEADDSNEASLALLKGIGAKETGSTLELIRRAD